MTMLRLLTLVVASTIAGAGLARADHVAAYDSYSGPYYNPNSARGVYGQAAGDIIFPVICDPAPPYCTGGNHYGTNAFAFQFTALETGVLESIWLPLWNRDTWTGTEGSVRVSLLVDAAGDPGGEIGSWDLQLTNPAPYSYQILNSDDAIKLTKDLVYWLRVDPLGTNSAAAWFDSYNVDGYGLHFTSLQGTLYGGSIMPAMGIYVLVPVPEASSIPATFVVVAALAWIRSRR